MLYGDTIQDTRQMFFQSWSKYLTKQKLSSLEHDIAQVILAHPEYHQLIEHPESCQNSAYYPELGHANPFLHMGLHLAIREQIATNRPTGITSIYNKLLKKHHAPMTVEHLMMEQLAECLWLSQKNNLPPDEKHYLEALENACNQSK